MSPRRRFSPPHLLRAILRGLGWRRGWGEGPRIVPLRPGRHGLFGAFPPSFGVPALPTKAGADPLDSEVHGEPRYSVRAEGAQLRRFTARGDQPHLTQVLLETARSLAGSLGMVLVEVHGRPREWTAANLDRSLLLQGLMGLRDLLGRGGLDMALFSADEAVEVFLDRFATLEIRCGGWHEPRFRGLLEAQGFARTARVSALPLCYHGAPPWTEADSRRVEEICSRLGLEAVVEAPDIHDAS